MPYKYSKSTGCFYSVDIAYRDLPTDLVDVSDETHALLFLAQAKGAGILPAADGSPQAVYNGGRGDVIDLNTVTEDDWFIPPPTLQEQALTALISARDYVYNNYGILNEPTPDAWVSYLKALMAIANGSDTTSTTLPQAPTT
ncbi:hypothetical protein [Asaia astilbis]|uniref:hypothetical protein n=1 Tax=Asaia astilbis TaxID=610244 RepID=UPI000685FE64|nr:hypothetical protein [Asaia astilbis]